MRVHESPKSSEVAHGNDDNDDDVDGNDERDKAKAKGESGLHKVGPNERAQRS